MKTLSILGSTGSIGVSTLELVAAHPDKFRIAALAAGTNLSLLIEQINAFQPEIVAVLDADYAGQLAGMLGGFRPRIVSGVEGMIEAATVDSADMVVAAIVGAAGLVPTAAAIAAGKDIALANKETLVTAGRIIMEMVERHRVKLYPVDSEHSAIFQSLQGHREHDIKRIILTASGGPFRNHTPESLADVTVKDALAHPNWSMGKKITIDSATMMNKGLEVIEAHWLFDIPGSRIDVLIHPQSIIHSMVEYIDGCMIAQLGVPDMKAPIAYALTFPERVPTGVTPLDLPSLSALEFRHPDFQLFPALKLAYRAMEEGESMPAVMNAANEVAVAAFLEGRISFVDIPRCIEKTMEAHDGHDLATIEDVLRVDLWGRQKATELVGACAASNTTL